MSTLITSSSQKPRKSLETKSMGKTDNHQKNQTSLEGTLRFANMNKKNRDRFIKIKNAHKDKNKFNRKYEEAKAEYENVKRQRKQDRERKLQRKHEMETALNTYKQKKKQKNKQLYAVTSKGQPVMKNRIEMLLDRIQSTTK